MNEINSKLKLILEWCADFEKELNPVESWIMRILSRSSKAKRINNIANILEIAEYRSSGSYSIKVWISKVSSQKLRQK